MTEEVTSAREERAAQLRAQVEAAAAKYMDAAENYVGEARAIAAGDSESVVPMLKANAALYRAQQELEGAALNYHSLTRR